MKTRWYTTTDWRRWAVAVQGGWAVNPNGYLSAYGIEFRIGPFLLGVTRER